MGTFGGVFAPRIVFFAGVMTSFSPCVLPLIPLVIAITGGASEKDTKKAFIFSCTFALGNALTFAVLGVCAALFGTLIGHASRIWFAFLAFIMFLATLQIWSVIKIFPNFRLFKFDYRVGLVGAFLAGVCGGFFSSACATPILIALLGYLSSGESMAKSAPLIFLYALGATTTAVLAGTFSAYTQKICRSKQYEAVSKKIEFLLGLVTLALGIYMFYLCF